MAWTLPQIPPELAAALLQKGQQNGVAPGAGATNGTGVVPATGMTPNTSTQGAGTGQGAPAQSPMPKVPGDSMNVTAGAPPPLQASMAPLPTQLTPADRLRGAAGIPRTPGTGTPANPPPAQPSDDPAISSGTGMPAIPKAPDLSNAPQVGLYKQYADALAKQAALKAPDPNQLRPHWYERLLGGLVGAASNDAGAGGNVTNRRLINANREYQAQEAPLEKQLEAIKAGGELAKNAGAVPTQDFENQMKRTQEGREQAAQQETGRHDVEEEGIGQQNAATAAATQAETARHNPVMEGTEQQRVANEAEANKNTAAYQRGELGIDKQRIAQAQQELEAKIGPIADEKTLDAEERADSHSLDLAQKQSADAITKSHSGIGQLQAITGNNLTQDLAADQAKWDAMRQAHAQTYAQKRAQIRARSGATSAAGAGGAGGPAKGFTRITASDGSVHDIPSNKLDAAKARDPKLVVSQ